MTPLLLNDSFYPEGGHLFSGSCIENKQARDAEKRILFCVDSSFSLLFFFLSLKLTRHRFMYRHRRSRRAWWIWKETEAPKGASAAAA